MPKLRVHAISMSLDGFVAGPDQSLDNPLGVGGEELHEWIFETRGSAPDDGPTTAARPGVDDDVFAAGFAGIGATVMGRNMFGPVRGEWARPGELERMVGRRTRVPPPRLRAHAPRPRADRDGGRHDLPLRHRRHRVGTGPGLRRRRRGRRPPGWRERPRSSSTCGRGLVDELTSPSRRCCSAEASGCSTGTAPSPRATSAPSSCRARQRCTHASCAWNLRRRRCEGRRRRACGR